ELRDALFCWKVAKFVKSNAIVYAKENMTIGIGAGQMSRVYSATIPRSRELTSLLILLVGVCIIWFGGESLARQLAGMLSAGLHFD
ncbi:hypothetical protein MJM04_28755, partial [Salmonella enterica subsp. enterica serovar Cerro]|nr:hypothetical protein [Salmonella enterica subsp. enterica serovar Cerro]